METSALDAVLMKRYADLTDEDFVHLAAAVEQDKVLDRLQDWIREAPTVKVGGGLEVSGLCLSILVGRSARELLLSSTDLMEGVVNVINGEAQSSKAPLFTPEEREAAIAEVAVRIGDRDQAEALFRDDDNRGEIAVWLRAMFADYLQDTNAAAKRFVRLLAHVETVAVELRAEILDGRVRVRHVAASVLRPWQFIALVMMTLLDDSLNYGRDLCRCRLDTCNRFFFAAQDPAGGPPRRLYCSREHMLEAHKRGASERVKKARAAAAKKAPKMRRRHK